MKIRKIKMINRKKTTTDTVSVNRKRLINNDSPFAIKEAYVKLRTSLMFCMKADKEGPCKVFAITSANPSEGKSLTAANIAISYAMLGKKTLLIDADMRKPTHRRLWKVDISTGLCDFLAGMGPLELVKVENLPLSLDSVHRHDTAQSVGAFGFGYNEAIHKTVHEELRLCDH